MGLLMMGFPQLRSTALAVAAHPIGLSVGRETFANAILGGAVITLMTWMQHATSDAWPRIVAAWSIAFVLAGAPLQHAIVISVEVFAALHAGAPFGYADWLGAFGFAALGNLVGGVGLVTALRLLQIGPDGLRMEREGGVPRVPPTPDVRG
jgi:formate/nitrite transporter FocA (FNT family)